MGFSARRCLVACRALWTVDDCSVIIAMTELPITATHVAERLVAAPTEEAFASIDPTLIATPCPAVLSPVASACCTSSRAILGALVLRASTAACAGGYQCPAPWGGAGSVAHPASAVGSVAGFVVVFVFGLLARLRGAGGFGLVVVVLVVGWLVPRVAYSARSWSHSSSDRPCFCSR